MPSSTESFWSEIKTYEERLKQDPASYCFAPLSEVYLRAGLLDDALASARTGTKRYPGFIAGQMALARACHQKGLFDECQRALELVTAAMPEHAEAGRLLARLYADAGREREAVHVLQVLLDFCPGDMTARVELESLQRRQAGSAMEDELELIELAEDDIIEEPEAEQPEPAPQEDYLVERVRAVAAPIEDPWSAIAVAGETAALEPAPQEDYLVERVRPVAAPIEDPWGGIAAAGEVAPQEPVAENAALETVWGLPEQQLADTVETTPVQDPLVTPTMAELYVTQGFPEKALDIYRTIVVANPQNQDAAQRLAELERQASTLEAGQAAVAAVEQVSAPVELPNQGTADKPEAVAVLEGWLENIRRLRTCR